MIRNLGEAHSSVAAFIYLPGTIFFRVTSGVLKGGVQLSQAGETEEWYWLGQVDAFS